MARRGGQLLDVLRTNPDLEVLDVGDIHIDILSPSSITTLHRLRYISLKDSDEATDGPALMAETLSPFYETLLRLHKRFGGSEILLNDEGFLWRTSDNFDLEEGQDLYSDEGLYLCTDENPDSDTAERLGVLIYGYYDPFYPRWVDRILQNEPGLQITFGIEAKFNEDIIEIIAPM
ncbi:hypothetical protein M407DRAFT_26434 [Tulasnella calospora MUT 4182]|uniref:Uncharacterized protein n=1 Tax=Tulasnella calospora MUT 4182 TaxID=1051891 RepID=A0A0C3Q503_9AGAM|nr:hypothetical protein M407DRAFT_26434 [Tulasnella calospora MUT 4182]